jgi:hypothetical protein
MDNVQNCDSCINILVSALQANRSYLCTSLLRAYIHSAVEFQEIRRLIPKW